MSPSSFFRGSEDSIQIARVLPGLMVRVFEVVSREEEGTAKKQIKNIKIINFDLAIV